MNDKRNILPLTVDGEDSHTHLKGPTTDEKEDKRYEESSHHYFLDKFHPLDSHT